MKSKADRNTVAHESESYPYLCVNILPRKITADASTVGIHAFFDRVNFFTSLASPLIDRGVHMSSDGNLQNVRKEDLSYIKVLIRKFEQDCRIRDSYETL